MTITNRLAEFLIKGKMLIPDQVENQSTWENETWEYELNGKVYRLAPCIEVEDGSHTYYLPIDKMKEEGFEFCNLTEASWEEVEN